MTGVTDRREERGAVSAFQARRAAPKMPSVTAFRRFALSLALSVAVPAALAMPTLVAAQEGADFAFALDRERRADNFDSAAARYAQTDAALGEVAREIAALTRQQDVIEPYMAGYGLTSADLGDVLAMAYFSAVMLADGGRTDDPTQAQVDGLRARIASLGDGFAGISATERQDLADKLLMDVLVQQAIAEGLVGMPALDAWMAEFATYNSQALGFDVTAVTMGPGGLVGSGTVTAAQPASNTGNAAMPVTGRLATGRDLVLGIKWSTTLLFVPGFNGGGLSNMEDMTVLLTDGRACGDCLEEVLNGTLAAYARENPDEMGRWIRQGANTRVIFADGEIEEIEPDEIHGAAPPGARIAGEFKNVNGTSVGIANTLTTNYLTFAPDGRFFADGNTSSVGIAATAWVDRAGRTGRYEIDGYRIRFLYDDGEVSESTFVLWEQDDEFVLIDGSAFYVPDDE